MLCVLLYGIGIMSVLSCRVQCVAGVVCTLYRGPGALGSFVLFSGHGSPSLPPGVEEIVTSKPLRSVSSSTSGQ